MATRTLPPPTPLQLLAAVLDTAPFRDALAALDGARTTGRRGYGPRALLACVVIKHLWPIPEVSRVMREVRQNPALSSLIGCEPSDHAIYRFERRLEQVPGLLRSIIEALQAALREVYPDYGDEAAIDATSIDAHCNSQPREWEDGPPRKISDPDATIGYRSATGKRKAGHFTGYSVHAEVCAKYRLPLSHRTETAREHESNFALALHADTRALS